MIVLRAASPRDAGQLADLIEEVWPGESPSPGMLMDALASPGRQTLVGTQAGRLVGFLDSFLTESPHGIARWELDLLGVVNAVRRMGLGARLVQESVVMGRRAGCRLARALVREDNPAGRRVFHGCGFRADGDLQILLVCRKKGANSNSAQVPAGMVAVHTLTYSGGWWEGELTTAALGAAAGMVGQPGFDRVGVLVPQVHLALVTSAAQWGYEVLGRFQWWVRMLDWAGQRAK